MVKRTRRRVGYWQPIFARPGARVLVLFYAGRTPTGRAVFYHHHHGDDLPHLHLSELPDRVADQNRVHAHLEAAHPHHHHPDEHEHDHDRHQPGHWHFAAAAAGSTALPLLVLALCWISFLISDEVNFPHLLAAQQRARPPPRHP